jgi:hypothetical protein
LVKIAVAKLSPRTRPCFNACEDTSSAAAVAPAARSPASICWRLTASGVVCVVASRRPGKPQPSVPTTPQRVPSSSKAWAISCVQVVLPLVPVTPISAIDCEASP